MNDQFLVLTPEKVVVSYRVAGFATRAAAHLVDLILVVACSVTLFFISTLIFGVLGTEASVRIGSLVTSVVLLSYFVLFEWLGKGSTPGKRAAKVRIVMVDGTPITFSAALYRNLLRPADFLPGMYLLGFLCMFANEKSQRLGDMAGGTMVVAEKSMVLAFHPAPHHVGIHKYESTLGDLRKMTIDEYYALKRICDRGPWLPPETLDWSVNTVWEPIAQRNGISRVDGVHPIYQMQAAVMKFGRLHNLI